jgi:hypothetical protein
MLPTPTQWDDTTIVARRDLCRALIDATPLGARMPAEAEDFFRDVVFNEPGILRIEHTRNPSRLGANDPRHLTVTTADASESWSWNRAIGAKSNRMTEAVRNAFTLYMRPDYPITACKDCGGDAAHLDHVTPSFKAIAAALTRPLYVARADNMWVLKGASLDELRQAHAVAILEWVCVVCHHKRERARREIVKGAT